MNNLEKRLEKLKQEVADLEAELKAVHEKNNKKWKPACGVNYYRVTSGGTIEYCSCDNDYLDEFCYLTQNCFKTKEEAQEHREKIEIYYKFKNYVEEHSELLDWEDDTQIKYCYGWNFLFKKFMIDTNCNSKMQGAIYASSAQILEDAIDYIGGEEVAKRYLFGIEE